MDLIEDFYIHFCRGLYILYGDSDRVVESDYIAIDLSMVLLCFCWSYS